MAEFMKKATLTSYKPPLSTTIMFPSPACSFDEGFHQRRVAGDVLADSVSHARKSPGLTRSARVHYHLPKQLSRSDTSLKLMQSSLCSLNSLRSLATFNVIFYMSLLISSGLPPLRSSAVTSVVDVFYLTWF